MSHFLPKFQRDPSKKSQAPDLILPGKQQSLVKRFWFLEIMERRGSKQMLTAKACHLSCPTNLPLQVLDAHLFACFLIIVKPLSLL